MACPTQASEDSSFVSQALVPPHRPAAPPLVTPASTPVHKMWSQWLDVVAHDDSSGSSGASGAATPPSSALHILMQGGEVFRSFLQFMLRSAEPHRGEQEDIAVKRSFAAARLTLRSFTNAGANQQDENASGAVQESKFGLDAMHVLGIVCCELLGGLQPGSVCCTMHICAVLQFLVGEHDPEVCQLLLQRHAPFVLLRGLDRPGCRELLLSLVLGVADNLALPPLVPGQVLRPVSANTVQQVLQYLRMTGWPKFVCAVLEQGVQRAEVDAGSSASRRSSPPRRRVGSKVQPTSPKPKTPVSQKDRMSPGPATPGCRSPGLLSLGATPQRLSSKRSIGEGATPQSSPLSSLALVPSSPSPSMQVLPLPPPLLDMEMPPPPTSQLRDFEVPPFPATDGTPVAPPWQHSPREAPDSCPPPLPPVSTAASPHATVSVDPLALVGDSGSTPNLADAEATQDSTGGEDEDVGHAGVALLVEFLASALDCCGRSCEALTKQQRSGNNETKNQEECTEAQMQVIQALFFESTLISSLFKLLKEGSRAEFESASLLHALLQDAMNPRRRLSSKADAVIALYVPHMELLSDVLTSTPSVASQKHHKRQHVQPLGALRSAVVQILAAMCDLAPERTLQLVKPQVWEALAKWFPTHRCNHIFQAACARILVRVVESGNPRLQQLVFSRHRLLRDLCDIVLAEGTCGDTWHELRPRTSAAAGSLASVEAMPDLEASCEAGHRMEKSQVAVRRKRHPGGLGGIIPVIEALVHLSERDAAKSAAAQNAPTLLGASAERRPLSELVLHQQLPQAQQLDKIASKSAADYKHGAENRCTAQASYLTRLVGMLPHWPEVLGALGRSTTATSFLDSQRNQPPTSAARPATDRSASRGRRVVPLERKLVTAV